MALIMPDKRATGSAGSLAGHSVLSLISPCKAQSLSWAGPSPWVQSSCAPPLSVETFQFPEQHPTFTAQTKDLK